MTLDYILDKLTHYTDIVYAELEIEVRDKTARAKIGFAPELLEQMQNFVHAFKLDAEWEHFPAGDGHRVRFPVSIK